VRTFIDKNNDIKLCYAHESTLLLEMKDILQEVANNEKITINQKNLILMLKSKGSTENFNEQKIFEFRIDYSDNICDLIKENKILDYSETT
jgi:hypothetical protein